MSSASRLGARPKTRCQAFICINPVDLTQDQTPEFSRKRTEISSLVKDNSPVAAEKNAIFENKAERAGQRKFLNLTACLSQILWAVPVIDRQDLLHDDRTFIERIGDKMSRGADDLHAAAKR